MAKIYLKNKDLLNEIIECKKLNRLTPKAQEMFILLANKIIQKMRYYNPEDKKDCMQTGLHDMFANWKNFDVNKSTNAFAYYTEVFKRGIAREYNNIYKRKGDPEGHYKHISIESSNDGEGLYSI